MSYAQRQQFPLKPPLHVNYMQLRPYRTGGPPQFSGSAQPKSRFFLRTGTTSAKQAVNMSCCLLQRHGKIFKEESQDPRHQALPKHDNHSVCRKPLQVVPKRHSRTHHSLPVRGLLCQVNRLVATPGRPLCTGIYCADHHTSPPFYGGPSQFSGSAQPKSRFFLRTGTEECT